MFVTIPPVDARLIDARLQPAYLAGHLAGSVSLQLPGPSPRMRSDEDLARLRRDLEDLNADLGLKRGTPVVLYEETMTQAMARTAFLLALAGNDVRLWLEGWQDQKLTREPFEPEPGEPWIDFRREYLLTADEALAHPRMFDIRTPEEHRGIAWSPCCFRGGRIPGSTFVPQERFLTPEGLLTDLGLSEGDDVGVYCHTGTRSAIAFWMLRSLGVRARNYLGSMHEWTREEDLPLERG